MPNLWYALRAQAEREDKIREALLAEIQRDGLEEEFGEIIIPSQQVSEIKAGKTKVSRQKIFPGYLFVEISVDVETLPDGVEVYSIPQGAWYAIMNTNGISGFVGATTDNPVPMAPDEVAKVLMDIEETEEAPRPKVEFEVGQGVKIKEGTFAEYDGNVVSINIPKGLVKVNVSIFGRMTPVELEYWQVEKL